MNIEHNRHAELGSASLRFRNKFGMTGRFLISVFFLFSSIDITAEKAELIFIDEAGSVVEKEIIEFKQTDKGPNPILKFLQKKQKNNRKITAALLAFPFPFGIVGLHRIYLGTKPYVPIAYIGTLGGVFGIIPLIDFFAILLDKDFERFENNGKVLMWVK